MRERTVLIIHQAIGQGFGYNATPCLYGGGIISRPHPLFQKAQQAKSQRNLSTGIISMSLAG